VGRRQAAAAAALLPAQAAAVVTSPLLRARRTAGALASAAPTVDARWMEMDFGQLEGRPVAEVRDLLWSSWADDLAWAPPGGESLASVTRRVTEACEELLPRIGREDVVVVTPFSPIKAAVAWALAVPPTVAGRLYVPEASITTIAAGDDGRPVLRSFGVEAP
jgi:broad specificity phosphatase PhoE